MLSKAIVKSFGDHPVEFYKDEKGDVWLTTEQIGTALGYNEPRKSVINIYNRHKKLLNDFSGVTKLVTPGGLQDVTVFNEIAVNFIALKAQTPKGDKFALWAARIIRDYRAKSKSSFNDVHFALYKSHMELFFTMLEQINTFDHDSKTLMIEEIIRNARSR